MQHLEENGAAGLEQNASSIQVTCFFLFVFKKIHLYILLERERGEEIGEKRAGL